MTKTNDTKTLIVAKHIVGPAANGHDGCHARIHHHGICPGVEIAAWLNNLGPDSAPYGSITAGQVRDNYLRSNNHVVAQDPHLAELARERRELLNRLQVVRRRLTQARAAPVTITRNEVTQ